MVTAQAERAFWVAWSRVAGVGPILTRRLEQRFGNLAAAWDATAADLLDIEGIGLQTADTIARSRDTIDPYKVLREMESATPNFWVPCDPEYPRLLLEIPDLPIVLYYRGSIQPGEVSGHTSAISLVGTRSPSEYGKRSTQLLSKRLAQAGFTIVSGLAAGVDAEAHRGCLSVAGRTIAVLGCGIDVIYPASNRALYQQIAEEGLILSEYPPGTQPDKKHFPRRNRIVAGISRATLVLEAPERSGALITARLANEYGRDVYALPGRIDNDNSQGCNRLIHKGAAIICDADHLLEELGDLPMVMTESEGEPSEIIAPFPSVEPTPAAIPTNLSAELTCILMAIAEISRSQGQEAVELDRIVQHTGLAIAQVSSGLLELEMLDLVTSLPGGTRYQRV